MTFVALSVAVNAHTAHEPGRAINCCLNHVCLQEHCLDIGMQLLYLLLLLCILLPGCWPVMMITFVPPSTTTCMHVCVHGKYRAVQHMTLGMSAKRASVWQNSTTMNGDQACGSIYM